VTGTVDLVVDGPIATIVIDNPQKRNALTIGMWEQLRKALVAAADRVGARVTVLRGAGGEAFCAGGDFDDLRVLQRDAPARDAFLHSVEATFDAIRDSRVPVLAMLSGSTMGGGMGLALACDIRLADSTMRMGIAAARLGVVPTVTEIDAFVRLVGPARTAELFYTGRHLDAAEAAALGLVNGVVPVDDLEREARALAERIAEAAPDATRKIRRLVFGREREPPDIAPSSAALAGAEFAEALTARFERRVPVFEEPT
jgi:enoyl-CoA hydratase/carnithine racemase